MSTLVGELIFIKRVYRNCSLILHIRVYYVELVEFDMLDFHIILGMDWLHACFSSIDCRMRVVKFNIGNEPVLE